MEEYKKYLRKYLKYSNNLKKKYEDSDFLSYSEEDYRKLCRMNSSLDREAKNLGLSGEEEEKIFSELKREMELLN